jgi:hypothetical protein
MESKMVMGVVAAILSVTLVGMNLSTRGTNMQLKEQIGELVTRIETLESDNLLLEQEVELHSHDSIVEEHSHDVTLPEHSHDQVVPVHSHDYVLPEHSHEIEGVTEFDFDHTHEVYSQTDHTHDYSELLNNPEIVSETEVIDLISENAFSREPDFVSGWINLLLVYVLGKDDSGSVHNKYFGAILDTWYEPQQDTHFTAELGMFWQIIDENVIMLRRAPQDYSYDEVIVLLRTIPSLPRVPANR